MDIMKIGPVELTMQDAEQLYESGKKYLVTYSAIYQMMYSQAQKRYYGHCIYRPPIKGEHLTRRGRFFAYTAADVNHLMGCKYVNE